MKLEKREEKIKKLLESQKKKNLRKFKNLSEPEKIEYMKNIIYLINKKIEHIDQIRKTLLDHRRKLNLEKERISDFIEKKKFEEFKNFYFN